MLAETHPQTIVVIPAYNPPTDGLWTLVQDLTGLGVERIVIVNDGSSRDKADVFNRLKSLPNCDVLDHAVNLGKGRALKTAFNFVLTQYSNSSIVVTADADSQHKPADIMNIIKSSLAKKSFTIGVRSFGNEVPFRSKLGNVVTKHIFRFLIGT